MLRKALSAIIVAVIAFFELCFMARAEFAWRLARTNSRYEVLSLRPVGAKVTPAELPRPGIFILSKGAGVPPAPALKLSRGVCIGMYLAMLAFLVFCISAIVLCPNGRSFHQEDGHLRTLGIADQSASGTGTEAPSSILDRSGIITVSGCLLFSYAVIGAWIIKSRRKESQDGKKRTEKGDR